KIGKSTIFLNLFLNQLVLLALFKKDSSEALLSENNGEKQPQPWWQGQSRFFLLFRLSSQLGFPYFFRCFHHVFQSRNGLFLFSCFQPAIRIDPELVGRDRLERPGYVILNFFCTWNPWAVN